MVTLACPESPACCMWPRPRGLRSEVQEMQVGWWCAEGGDVSSGAAVCVLNTEAPLALLDRALKSVLHAPVSFAVLCQTPTPSKPTTARLIGWLWGGPCVPQFALHLLPPDHQSVLPPAGVSRPSTAALNKASDISQCFPLLPSSASPIYLALFYPGSLCPMEATSQGEY